jgi:D-alanine-D-alanine ligase
MGDAVSETLDFVAPRRDAVIWFNVPAARLDSADVLNQVRSIGAALTRMGYRTHEIPFSLDVDSLRENLRRLEPAFVVNLVEEVEEDGSLIHLAPAMLESLGVRYTGCPPGPMYLTTDKILAKRKFLDFGIDTPSWLSRRDSHDFEAGAAAIIKAVGEDASIGLDEACVVSGKTEPELLRLLEIKRAETGREHFAERFIEGREFNIGLFGGYQAPQLLPVAEILFPDDFAVRRRILDYRAKWDETSEQYQRIGRTYDFPARDLPTVAEVQRIAELCWRKFRFKGYARADFRIDSAGKPWLLEINPNPDIGPESGFMAASRRAGLDEEDVLHRIVHLA